MATKRDYYEVLGIQRGASQKEIADAYRKMAMQYHPDRNPGDEEAVAKFKEAAEAFEVLHDDQKRAQYDQFGHAAFEGGRGPQFRDINDIFGAFGDMFGFGDVFGGRGGRRRVRRGADIRCHVALNLEEAYRGCTKEVVFDRHQPCGTCGGSGAAPGTSTERCSYCGGSGAVVQNSGFFSLQRPCPRCHGQGETIAHPCPTCDGQKYVLHRIRREVQIPAGVDKDTRLRLQGEGEPSPEGGPAGDCYVFIDVKRHKFFERDGHHLICQVPISYSQAALGAKIEIPTFDGPEEIDVARGTQSGEVFRLRGRGMPDPRRAVRGDLLVQVHVEVARHLTEEHEAVLRQLAEIEKAHVSPKRKGFFQMVKDFFLAEEEDGE